MTDIRDQPETEQFGARSPWLLLNRNVVDNERTTVRVMGVQGRGVLFQTARQVRAGDGGWEEPVYDNPIIIDDVMILETMMIEPSSITDGEGNPMFMNRTCSAREVLDVGWARKRFQNGKEERDKKREKILRDARKAKSDLEKQGLMKRFNDLQAEGPQDHLMIVPGIVLTQEGTKEPLSPQAGGGEGDDGDDEDHQQQPEAA